MKLNVIPKAKLVEGRWYVGRGRNGNVALWNGQNFLTIGMKFADAVVKTEPYYEETSGCFQPFSPVDEGKIINPFGKQGWDAHYGHLLETSFQNETLVMDKLHQNVKAVHRQIEADLAEGDPKAKGLPRGELNAARKFLGMPPLPPAGDLWIGAEFSEPANGVLILGESTYGEDPPLSKYVPSWCRGELPKSDRTFSRIFNAFSGAKSSSASNAEREAFWATIAFTNFVQQPVGPTNKHKASSKHFSDAVKSLSSYLRYISPRGVLILGKGQAEFSAPAIRDMKIPYVVCPHPTGYGIKTATLKDKWNELQNKKMTKGNE